MNRRGLQSAGLRQGSTLGQAQGTQDRRGIQIPWREVRRREAIGLCRPWPRAAPPIWLGKPKAHNPFPGGEKSSGFGAAVTFP